MAVVGHDPQSGWNLFSGAAVVSNQGEGYGGGKALKLRLNAVQDAGLRRAISWNPAEKIAFIDFQIKPAAQALGGDATIVANGAQIAFQVPEGGKTGEIWVYHGNDNRNKPEQWLKTQAEFPLMSHGKSASQYIRVTIRQDYEYKVWDLFIDGNLVHANLDFEGRGINLESLDFFGGEKGDTLIDELSVHPENMLFPDEDRNGIADAWEIANGLKPSEYNRDTIKPGTSDTYLKSYRDSLWNFSRESGKQTTSSSGGIPSLDIDDIAPHTPVGSLKGALSVGGDGSANYSIPIDIPKGTAGMEPKLSLGYSSNSGNGMVGVGWNLTGMQRITRGPSSAAKDGSYDPLDFDSADRFFLDGERLVCVSGNNYGEPGSEYRTEIDSYARITAIGSGPASWKIETKAGLTVTLGGNAGSKTIVPQGILSWSVTRVADSVGNYYDVSYQRDSSQGMYDFVNHRPERIDYTGNTRTKSAPYCSVRFDYEDRPDVSRASTTHAGYLSSKRLAKIRVLTSTYVNHSYRLSYGTSYQTGRSFLKSIRKHMEDSDHHSKRTPPTTFTYDGLEDPGNSTDNPLWKSPGKTNVPVYGNDLDATGEVNSMVSVDDSGSTISLVGDVARAYDLPGSGKTLYGESTNKQSRLRFEFYSSKLKTGAIIGLDNNRTYEKTDADCFFRIGGDGSDINMSGGLRFGGGSRSYDTSSGEWKTFDVPLDGSGEKNYLVVMCVDNDIADGIDSARFRNVRVYNSNETSANVSPVTFKIDQEMLRFYSDTGKDLGVVSLDVNGDSLPDLADWRVCDYNISGTTLVPRTVGSFFINTPEGFKRNNSFKPPVEMPLGVRPADNIAYGYNSRHDLLAVPIDVDGDGNLDLMESSDVRTTTGFIRNGYKFHTLIDDVWTVKPGWNLPFTAANLGSSSYGGKRRFEYFQWADLNTDGYPDLILQTTSNGELYSATTGTLSAANKILGNNTATVFLNKGSDGPGWIQNNGFGLPESLVDNQKDVGRRLVDINGDGITDIVEAKGVDSNAIRHTYFMHKTSGYRWNSTRGMQNPESSRYDLPTAAAFVDGSDGNRGAFLIDLNGDGLVDFVESNLGTKSKVWMNRAGVGPGSAWKAESQVTTTSSASSYDIPFALHATSDGAQVPYGYEMMDLNGDGLVDILYSSEENDSKPGSDNTTLINTGDGWKKRSNWALPASKQIYDSTSDRTSGKRWSKLQDLNGDGFPDLITDLIDHSPKVWFNNCKPEVLISVVDGMNTELTVSYNRLNDPEPTPGFGSRVYKKGPTDLPAGQIAVIDSRLVVSRYSEPNGRDGIRYHYQRYGDLRYDRIHEASLGFGWIEAMDGLTGQTTRTKTSRVFPFGGSPILTETWVELDSTDLIPALVDVTAGKKLLSRESADYAELASKSGPGGTIRRPVQTGAEQIHWDLAGKIVSKTTTEQAFDKFGFVTHSTSTSLDDSKITNINTYAPIAGDDWHLGRLTRSTVIKNGAGNPSISKISAFTYNGDGLLESETIEPGIPAFSSTKTYAYDKYGNIIRTTVTALGVSPRQSESGFGINAEHPGRFLISETNPLYQTVSYTYDNQKALLAATKDIYGGITCYEYDGFGTLRKTINPDQTRSVENTGYYPGTSPISAILPTAVTSLLTSDVAYFRAAQTSGSPVAIVYLDSGGREVATRTTILRDAATSGTSRYRNVYSVTNYDRLGRKIKIYEPFDISASLATTISYDAVGRVRRTTHPDGQSDKVLLMQTLSLSGSPLSYSEVQNRNNLTTSVLKRWEDQHGRLVRSQDPSGQITIFDHDHEGRVTKATVGGVELLNNTFDLLGNKTSVREANSGTSSSTYNALGEVLTSINARGDITSYTYDSIGRPRSIAKPNVEGTYQFEYYGANAAYGWGKAKGITGPNGYAESFTYDEYGRTISTERIQFGGRTTTSTTYDALGRVFTETDAGGLTVVHEYDAKYSFPTALRIGPGSAGGGTLLWQAGKYDSQGRATSQTLANGVTTTASYFTNSGKLATLKASAGTLLQDKSYDWSSIGNLISRSDAITNKSESFSYDSINRLTNASYSNLNGATHANPPKATYTYGINGNLSAKPGAALTYAGPRPHAVTTATIKGAARTYTYNTAGYVTTDSKRTYGWTSFGQLASLDYLSAPAIQKLNGSSIFVASRVKTDFDFDAGGNRARQRKERTALDDSRLFEETLYLGSYEQETHKVRAAGSATYYVDRTVHRHSIAGFAVYTKTEKPGTAAETKLTTLLKDHLGSTDVLYSKTWNPGSSSFTAASTENQSFDPWGERRASNTLIAYRTRDSDPFRTSGEDYDRGYTGHEQLDDSGLIHMNGRIYDPELGRVLSPDPYVQVAEYSQNFNRYSYVMNNPLNLTDPSGFSWLGDVFHDVGGWLKENWRTVVVIAVAVVLTVATAGVATAVAATVYGAGASVAVSSAAAYAAWGATAGILVGSAGTAIAGGNSGDVLRGALIGCISGAITGGLLHGLEQAPGVINEQTALHIAGHGVVGGASNAATGASSVTDSFQLLQVQVRATWDG